MVQLEEVEDQELDQAQPGPIPDSAYDSADFTDTSMPFHTRLHARQSIIVSDPRIYKASH